MASARNAPDKPGPLDIDDTHHFKLEARKGNAWKRLVAQVPELQRLQADRDRAVQALYAKEESLTRKMDLIDGWLRDAMLLAVAQIVAGKAPKASTKGRRKR
jgi:hypothetical protein